MSLSTPHPGKPAGIFVVHGRDEALKLAVARLLDNATNENVIVLAEQPNRGRTIAEKLDDYANANFAVVLLTPDDRVVPAGGEEPVYRARQNVILELGVALGKLGRDRVCVLRKARVELPSDFEGVLIIEADETGAWKLPLLQELVAASIAVDWRRAR